MNEYVIIHQKQTYDDKIEYSGFEGIHGKIG